MVKMTTFTFLMLSITSMAFAEPKVGDSCTSDAQCQPQTTLPDQPTPLPTLKCDLKAQKCINR